MLKGLITWASYQRLRVIETRLYTARSVLHHQTAPQHLSLPTQRPARIRLSEFVGITGYIEKHQEDTRVDLQSQAKTVRVRMYVSCAASSNSVIDL